MQLFIILVLLGSRVMLTTARATKLVDKNNRETAEAVYEEESEDDPAAEDYAREDQEPMHEAQEKDSNQGDDLEVNEEQRESRDLDAASDQDKNEYDSFSENGSASQDQGERRRNSNLNSEKNYQLDNTYSRTDQQFNGNAAPEQFYSHSNIKQSKRPRNNLDLNERSIRRNPDYDEKLFKMIPAQPSKQQNDFAKEEERDQARVDKQYNIINRVKENGELNFDRNRRHAQNENKPMSGSTLNEKEEVEVANESSENAIISNIKKLSEQDLEQLLNSLPEDKRALLKKIMDKREITKKSGVVDESSYLEGGQGDTSKLEGGYSIGFNSEAPLTPDTVESSKQPENSENVSSKTPIGESGSRESGSKSEISHNADMKNDEPALNKGSKNEVNIYCDAEEMTKSDNKRETNIKDFPNKKISLENSKIPNHQLDTKYLSDLLENQDENEDWLDTRSKENEVRIEIDKRDTSQKESAALQDSVKSLEDSFPASNTYENINLDSEMVPLIRVKRTEKNPVIKKEDYSYISNAETHFNPDVENDEKNEFKDYEALDPSSDAVRNDREYIPNIDSLPSSDQSQLQSSK